MTSRSPHLQFGIEVGDKRSYTWRVRSGAKHPELFVERENLPPAVHLSLHASGQWHLKVRRQRVHQWPKPAEITPGYTHALAIVRPAAVAVVVAGRSHVCSRGCQGLGWCWSAWMNHSNTEARAGGAGQPFMVASRYQYRSTRGSLAICSRISSLLR
jgi:hypothetical protein